MIDVWILTVVLGSRYRLDGGMTSYQLKFYSEDEASKQQEHSTSSMSRYQVDTFITKTQEQKIN